MTRVYILLGGFFGPDGWATSAGMLGLASQLKPTCDVKVFTWDRYRSIYADLSQPTNTPNQKIVVVGYSGGGSRATWLARDYPDLTIDLMVLYDPSPTWQMVPVGANVKHAVTYENATPRFFGLGGGKLVGPHVERVPIKMQHILVQGSQALHNITVADIARL